MERNCYILLRNEGDRQEIRGVFCSYNGAVEARREDIKESKGKWNYIDFVIQEEELRD